MLLKLAQIGLLLDAGIVAVILLCMFFDMFPEFAPPGMPWRWDSIVYTLCAAFLVLTGGLILLVLKLPAE